MKAAKTTAKYVQFPLKKAFFTQHCTAAAKAGLKPADFSKVIIYSHVARYQQALGKKLGFTPDQIQDGNYTTVGNTGAACAPLALVGALETANPTSLPSNSHTTNVIVAMPITRPAIPALAMSAVVFTPNW